MKPGDWLTVFREAGQSFDQYAASCANRKSTDRSIFYLQPMGRAGEHHAEVIRLMRDYAEAFFCLPARVLEPIPLFEAARISKRGQSNATMIHQRLAKRVPPDALVHLGVTEEDLFSKGLRYVFGEGSLTERAGVCSLQRLQSADPLLFVTRAVKLLSHEAGHILSIEHCVQDRCVMRGANTLEESDRHSLDLCPMDLEKLEWNAGFDRAERERRLREFYDKTGLRGVPA